MKNHQINWLKVRVFLVFLLFLCCFSFVFLRILELQVLDRWELQGLAERQHQRIIELVPNRGAIYDRNLNVLAKSLEAESLYAHPRQVQNPPLAAEKIAPVLGEKTHRIEGRLRSRRPFVWLQRKLTPEEAKQIRALGIKGVNFLKESQRYYPNRELAANLLGFVGVDSQGLEGIEFQHDEYLRAEPHQLLLEIDARGEEIVTESPVPPIDVSSCSLVLTIDLNIQHIVEKAINQGLQDTGSKSAIVVVMDPLTGQILAMASRPSINPNAGKKYGPDSVRNRAITDTFEPGSIFKVFLLAAALEEKVAHRNDIFFCHNGTYQIGNKIIHDHKKYGWLTLQKIIKFSSNIGASQIGLKVGAKRLYRYIREFGFGAPTGIRLPGEAKGIVRNPDRISEIGIANTAFGQGISVTAIQLVSALSSIANGGILMRPYVVDRIIDSKGEVTRSFHPEPRRQVLSSETCREVTHILKQVVEPDGTGTQAALPGYPVAGKTGTAQKIDPLLKTYADDRYIASFMGFVPADAPRLAILVVIDEPKGIPYGGVVAAPVFRTIAQQALQYLNVPPGGNAVVARRYEDKMDPPVPERTEAPSDAEEARSGTAVPSPSGFSLGILRRWLERIDLGMR